MYLQTMMRKVLREYVESNPKVEPLIALVKNNVGFVFTNGDLGEIEKQLLHHRVCHPILFSPPPLPPSIYRSYITPGWRTCQSWYHCPQRCDRAQRSHWYGAYTNLLLASLEHRFQDQQGSGRNRQRCAPDQDWRQGRFLRGYSAPEAQHQAILIWTLPHPNLRQWRCL